MGGRQGGPLPPPPPSVVCCFHLTWDVQEEEEGVNKRGRGYQDQRNTQPHARVALQHQDVRQEAVMDASGERGTSRPARVGRGRGQREERKKGRKRREPPQTEGTNQGRWFLWMFGKEPRLIHPVEFEIQFRTNPHLWSADLRAAFHRTGRVVPRSPPSRPGTLWM